MDNEQNWTGTSYCVYCPSDSSLPCIPLIGVSASECEQKIACEFEDGSVQFNLTADECR